MKSKLIQTKLGMITTVACLAFANPAHAIVTWLVSEDGSGVTMTAQGSLSMPSGTFGGTFISDTAGVGFNGTYTGIRNGEVGYLVSAGVSGSDPYTVGAAVPSTGIFSGSSFQSYGTTLYLSSATDTSSPYLVTPTSSMTFATHTIDSLFGTNLDGGPVTIWTANGTLDTIQVALAPVPEPSSTALLGLGGLAFILRRKR